MFFLRQEGARIVPSASRGDVVSTMDASLDSWINLGDFAGKANIVCGATFQ